MNSRILKKIVTFKIKGNLRSRIIVVLIGKLKRRKLDSLKSSLILWMSRWDC